MSDSMPSPGERYCPTCERSFSGRERCPDDDTVLVRLLAPTDRLVGSEIDQRYTIQRRIGSGGMGAVYGAVQHSVGREVAIKVVNPTLVDDPYIIKRFLREAKLTSRLSHPNAVAVLDFGQTPDGLFYLVMELITGRTLSEVLKAEGSFAPERVVRIGSQILFALMGAHQLSIVHRDLKPSNVIVLDSAPGSDLVKVLDFGLAKSLSHETTMTSMTGSGALLGTPAYMPPEVATGGEADARGDLYSLGVILYQLASGRLPFVGDSMHELLVKLSRESAPPLESFGVPAALARVIERLMEKSPEQRFPSAALALAALDRAEDELDGEPVRRKSPSGIPLPPGDDETLPATPRLPIQADLAPSDPLAPTHHGGGVTPPAVGMAPTPAPPLPTPAPLAPTPGPGARSPLEVQRARRRFLVALAVGVGLIATGVTIAIALGLSGGRGAADDAAERAPAPSLTPVVDGGPAGGSDETAREPPPASVPAVDAGPAPKTEPPPRWTPRSRERRREREPRERPSARKVDGGYPF